MSSEIWLISLGVYIVIPSVASFIFSLARPPGIRERQGFDSDCLPFPNAIAPLMEKETRLFFGEELPTLARSLLCQLQQQVTIKSMKDKFNRVVRSLSDRVERLTGAAIAYASEAPTTMEIEDLLRAKLQCMGNYMANTVPDLVLGLESLGAIQKFQKVKGDYRETTDC